MIYTSILTLPSSTSLQFQTNSFLVDSIGPISMSRNCLQNNLLGVSSVNIYSDEATFSNNYGYMSRGLKCALASRYSSQMQIDNNLPTCTNYDATTCMAGTSVADTGVTTTGAPVTVTATPAPTAASTVHGTTKTPTAAPASSMTVSRPPTSASSTSSVWKFFGSTVRSSMFGSQPYNRKLTEATESSGPLRASSA
jgi:hypothetical protein